VPEDVSIVTFYNAPVQDVANGQMFTTWLIPEIEEGKLAAEMLLKKIAKQTERCPSRSVPFTHTEDYSCARQTGIS